jgi:glycosyltransferase involved in cell wall biosynthesis
MCGSGDVRDASATRPEGRRVLLTADAVGGVWQYALDLAGGLAAAGIEATLAVLGPGPDAAQMHQVGRIERCRVLPTGLPLDWTAASAAEVNEAGRELAAIAVGTGADLVHLHSPAFAAGGRFDRPVVASCHSCMATWWEAVEGGPLPADFAWRRDLVGLGLRAADAVVAPSAAFATATAAAYRLPVVPEVVPNGRREGSSAPVGDPETFVFTAGRLWDRGKNVAALGRAAGRLSVPVKAAGPLRGPNGDAVSVGAIEALGHLGEAEIRAYLARRPVFVSLARYEPFGLAVLEAAQAGCGLVLSDIPTFRELWDGAAAFVPADDDAAAARAIHALIADPVRRAALGGAARERSRTFTVEAMTDGVLSVYRQVLARRAEAGRAAA